MAVTNVANIKEELRKIGYTSKDTTQGYQSMVFNRELTDKEITKFYAFKCIHGLSMSIKRSGAGLRVLFM